MNYLKNMLVTIALLCITSINSMEPEKPARPSKPSPVMRPTTSASAQNRPLHTNPPQRPRAALPAPLESTTASSSIQDIQYNNPSTKRALPTPPSKPHQKEPTTTSSSTQNRPFNSLPPQRTLPALPPLMESTTASSSTQSKQSSRYAEVLDYITATMSDHDILINNTFTHPFIEFIRAQHLSDEDTTALLEAVAMIYMTPTGNNKKDEPYSAPSFAESFGGHGEATKGKQVKEKKSIIERTQKHFTTHDLIMLLDPEKEETLQGSARLLVQDALLALYEQAAPIIMSSNILGIITHLRHTIGENNLQMLRNSNQSDPFAQKLLTSYKLHENPLHLIILSLIDFDSKHFTFYFHRSEDLVLVIPQQYIIDNIEDASQFNLQDQAKKCGFNPAMTTPIDNLSAENLLLQLKIQETSQHKTTFIHNLISLFIPQKSNGELITPAEVIPWIIYLGGHGGAYYQSIGSIREQLDINQQNLAFYQEALQNNRKHHDAQQNIIIAEENIKKYEKILQGKSDWPDSQLVIGQANIAGTTMDDFSSLMTFFDHNLYMYYVHYTSCLDGGYKQTFVNETLSSLNVNFIVSTQGLDERPTQGPHLILTFNSKAPYTVVSKKPFSAFFKVLKIFIDRPETFVETKKDKTEQEPFAYVLSAIVPAMNPQNQPFIRFPGVGVFGALSLGKKTKNITNTLIKAHEIENRPIDLSDTNIDLITITPSRINASLNFGKNMHCAIISPTPALINPSHEAIHLFKEISFENPLQALIFNFISFNARIHPQTFIVKKVTGISIKQSATNVINNLIIQIKHIPGQTIRAHLEVAFEFNGNMYQCETEINNFEDPHLAKFIYSLNFAPTTDMNYLSKKFLTSQEIKKLKQPITLESIAQLIDKKIDTQQPSLKDTAVKKELSEFVKEMHK